MKIPIVKYNDTLLSIISLFAPIKGITIFPFIIIRERFINYHYPKATDKLLNHEKIHIEQQKEMLILPFFVFYFIEWLVKLFIYGFKSYRNLSFEREAYKFEGDMTYLSNRKRYAFLKYVIKE
jgi:hypothetical protein